MQGSGAGALAIKLDMTKAYDRVEWSFLRVVMLKLGFPMSWANLVISCVESASFATLVNSSPSAPFRPKHGLCQGDPLPPFLFLFVLRACLVCCSR